MKNYLNSAYYRTVLLFSAIIVSIFLSFGLTSCSSGQSAGDIVCDYGAVLCDVSTTLCNDIPGVPPQVCNYLDLACYNLNVICDMRDSTETIQYQTALTNIQTLTAKLRAWKVSREVPK